MFLEPKPWEEIMDLGLTGCLSVCNLPARTFGYPVYLEFKKQLA